VTILIYKVQAVESYQPIGIVYFEISLFNALGLVIYSITHGAYQFRHTLC